MKKKKVVKGQAFIFNNKQDELLQDLLDEARIIHFALQFMRNTDDIPEEGKKYYETYKITFQNEVSVVFDLSNTFDNISKHLKPYSARKLQCYKNVKARLEALGLIIKESKHSYSDRLVWVITKK